MRRTISTLMATALLGLAAPALAQQSADPEYRPSIAQVEVDGEAPVIAVDQAHANFHRLDGRFAPFGRLAAHGGYLVRASDARFSPEMLDGMDILVISNAGESPSDAEIDALVTWIEQGGSLLLIADHAPFGGFAMPIAERLGVGMGDGYVVAGGREDPSGIIDFDGDDLGAHSILSQGGERRVDSVRTFLGQSLIPPEGAIGLLALPDDAVEVHDVATINAYANEGGPADGVGDRFQALAMTVGDGRVMVSGEAAMFTSQVMRVSGQPVRRLGVSEADNEAYVLNILDWLAGRLN